ncbi:N-acylneuraminate cytidylyltransferase A-like [Eriocheir sinensis]|uniref:N-acylneuraminate cytidylyltransferase A-like n=1 Tax=Eriocheir sinensis TaxID=95602 RepID=UPI0021C6F534|nr:N-acylneuraminate cytidylyltransferase A-like [Eriocheir sinensis]XP_050686207.1 N-acylneuraminate cytidylyltransferase A-like [Eriocheir sinensis]XP_050686208.1 N-acylneuraminate cytidylyltransferase A-like [Eriocheir sinensis]
MAHTPPSLIEGEWVAGLVLARGGSKGVKSKNLLQLDRKPLLRRTLEVMHKAKCFKSVWVSTDSDLIAECAREGEAQVHWRAPYTATDDASSVCAVQEFLKHHPEITIVCLVQCTSPFLKAEYLQSGLEKMGQGYDSVFSVTRRHLLRWSEGEFTVAQNFSPKHRPRRQDWPGELSENGMFYAAKVELVKSGLLQGNRCGYVEVPQEDSLEIDSPFDAVVAQAWINYCQEGSV